MMKKMKNTGIAGILSAVLIMLGVLLIGTPCSNVIAKESIPNIDKFMNVKWQMSENAYKSEDGKTVKDLRIVSTIDADEDATYGNVGFEITFLEDSNAEIKMEHRVQSVFRRISAKEGGIKYEYGPKVFHATSEWLATCTITEIPEEYWDNGIVIKPYITLKGSSTRYYGIHRYLTMLDQENKVITIPVEGKMNNPQIDGSQVKSYDDGTYTHVRVSVSDFSTLPSISKYTVTYEGGSKEVKYRYLLSTVANDQSWYEQSDADDKVIVTAGDMRGFQTLSKTNNFATDTIYLGANIDLSPNWKSSTTAPTTGSWTPIGYSEVDTTAAKFAGIFDGDMHSISGVHIDKGARRIGLFGETATGSEIKNLELKNSYIRSTLSDTIGRVGSIVGHLNGSVKNIKCASDVKVVGRGRCAGGIVGTVDNGSIENCWFDGKLQMARTSDVGTRKDMGGILGGMYNGTDATKCTITNCLVTGELDIAQTVGGICGMVYTKSTLEVSDTLFAGSFVEAGATVTSGRGTVFGDVASGTTTLTNVYVQDGTGLSVKIGNAGSNKDTGVTVLQPTNLTDDACFVNTQLDFYMENQNEAGEWVGIKNGLPALKIFAKSDVLDITKGIYVDTSWYKTEPYEISTISQLYGLAKLSQTVDFAGKTITLTDTLVLNEDDEDAENWGTNIPKYLWQPIKSFAGTFNGDMNTISGIYVKSDETNIGLFKQVSGTVENLTLDNSYIENTTTSADHRSTGSIVGELTGTLDTVKSNAHVVLNGSQYAGGLVGKIAGSTGEGLLNCWFAGSVSGTGAHHGTLLGGITNSSSRGYIKNCLSTGTIDYVSNAGGLVGAIWNANIILKIEDTLFAGEFTNVSSGASQISNTIGRVYKCSIDLTNVYVQTGTGVSTNLGTVNGDANAAGVVLNNDVTTLTSQQLALDAARVNTELSICDRSDYGNSSVVGKTKFWYVSDKHPVLASFSEPIDSYALKVATYNIGFGRKNGEDKTNEVATLNAIESFINSSDIDVYFLQEVNGDRTLDELQLPGYEIQYHEMDEALLWGSVGMAVVSKYHIVETQYVRIAKTDGLQDRGIYKVVLDVNNDGKADVVTISTHLDNESETDSATGITMAKEMISAIQEATPNMPIIFAGDLNQAYNGDYVTEHIKELTGFIRSTTHGVSTMKTFYNASFPNGLQLDYIYTNSNVVQGTVEVLNPTMGDNISLSDHRPLVATLYIKAQ